MIGGRVDEEVRNRCCEVSVFFFGGCDGVTKDRGQEKRKGVSERP